MDIAADIITDQIKKTMDINPSSQAVREKMQSETEPFIQIRKRPRRRSKRPGIVPHYWNSRTLERSSICFSEEATGVRAVSRRTLFLP